MKLIRTTGQHSAPSEFFRYLQFPWLLLSLRALAGLFGVMSFAIPETIFAGGADSSPAIQVRVNNYTQASPTILAGAEREASRILGRAGLRTVWLDCPAGATDDPQDRCRKALEATDIVLRVLSESSQNKFRDTAFGFAVVPVLASVYYDYVAHLARRDNAEFEIPIILGCVIAHEIGHLLLGSNSHSVSGIMQGHWERGQIRQAVTGTLIFTPEQAKLIQAETQKRSYTQDIGKPAVGPTVIELVSGFLVVVDGQIGNLDGLKFILDTGASHSLIDRKVADRLRLPRRPGDVVNFDGHIAVAWADISGLRVGPMSTETLSVMVVKLAELSELAGAADGIIGLDVLSRSKKFTIDYDRRTVSIQIADDATPVRATSAYFVVPLVVQGLRMELIVDTGLQEIVLYKNRLNKRLPKVRTEGKLTNVAMGRLRGTRVELPGVRIAGAEVVATAILIDGPDEHVLPGVDGVLGTTFLSAKRIKFDFDARVLRWQ
jgi:predicted aspartyl protease